jgi:hypothetical protein
VMNFLQGLNLGVLVMDPLDMQHQVLPCALLGDIDNNQHGALAGADDDDVVRQGSAR